MNILAYILSGLSLLMSIFLLVRLSLPLGFLIWIPKVLAGALAPFWAIVGAIGAIAGWLYEAYWAIPMGIIGASMMILYVWRCTRDHTGFEDAFGADWSDQITLEQTRHMVQKRWSWFLKMKASPEPTWERDISFWTLPGTDRDLLCDIWRPANGDLSGLVVVYVHGGAWYFMNKDVGTRPFFRHLVAQGHTVMDVAYRLCPETDIYGMIGDVKRAIAWIKANADRYGVDPEKIVLAGGSAGGHLAQLAGYTPEHPEFTPEDVSGADLSVCGVVSYYGFTDVMAMYQYMKVQKLEDPPPAPVGENLGSFGGMRYYARFDVLFGDWPEDAPDLYQLASPITHGLPGSPPTLLIQGEQDIYCPVDATRTHYAKLAESGVPAINVTFPWTDHAFDLILPQLSPSAQSALYDVDRFLGMLLNAN